MSVLTKRQFEVLEWIRHFMQEKGYSPAFDEIGSGVGLSSLATVHKHLTNLERKGYIRRDYNRSRSIELTKSKRMAMLNTSATVTCQHCGAETQV